MAETTDPNRSADTAVEPPSDADAAYARELQDASPYLMSVAASRLPRELWSKVAPSDIVQEALCEASRSRDRPTHTTHFKAWLRKIVVNKVIDAHRRFRVAQCRDAEQELPLSGLYGPDALVSPDTSPSGNAAKHESRQRLIEALARLPEGQRDAIVMREFDHLTFPEIGHHMGRTAEAARSLWWRALESLRAELEEPDERRRD